MLAKVVLVLIYLLLVFLAAKVLDISSSWLELSCVASPLFNPLALSVRKLKNLLDERGVSYAGVVDKRELVQLVEESGSFSTEENCSGVEDSEKTGDNGGEITHFSGASHLFEEVEDTKASGWLVHVIPQHKRPLLRQKQWQRLSRKVTRFGIRTGVFDCGLEPLVCLRNGWEDKCLVFSSPRGDKPKGNVMMNVYNSKPSVERVFSWMNSVLARKVRKLQTHEDYMDFLRKDKRTFNGHTKVVLFGRLDDPPALLSSLSIKFTGRVKFGYFKITEHNIQEVQEKVGIPKVPKLLIVTPEQEFYYGIRKGEILRYKAMELFLTSIHPEVNDLFLLALVLVNQACFLELFVTPGGILRKSLKFVLLIGVANTALILAWLPLVGVFKLTFVQPVLNIGLKICRYIMSSDLVSLTRYHFLTHSKSSTWFLMGFFAYGLFVNRLKRKFKCCVWSNENDEESPDWFYQDIIYFQRLFYSFRTTRNPPNIRVFEDGFDLLIQRLAIPDLWLHPLMPMDFFKDLPLWKNCECQPERENQHGNSIGKLNKNLQNNCDPNVCKLKSKPVNVILGKECVICLELYIRDCIMVALPCRHGFHQHCLEKWFNSGNHCRNLNCPVCRWPAYKPKSQVVDVTPAEVFENP